MAATPKTTATPAPARSLVAPTFAKGTLFDFDAGVRRRGPAVAATPAPPPRKRPRTARPGSENADAGDGGELRVDLTRRDVGGDGDVAWGDLRSAAPTPEAVRDLRMLRLRRYADPKHHFKADDFRGKRGALPEKFQIGTVVSGLGEVGLARRERRRNIALEFLADDATRRYASRVFREVQGKAASGGKNAYERKRSKQLGRFNKRRLI